MQKIGVEETELKYTIDTELSPGNLKFLPEYLRRHYLLQHEKYRAFRRLFPLYMREPAFQGYRRSEWLRFDPHPLAYFRIAQLEGLEKPEKIKHTFLKSIKDALKGFLRA